MVDLLLKFGVIPLSYFLLWYGHFNLDRESHGRYGSMLHRGKFLNGLAVYIPLAVAISFSWATFFGIFFWFAWEFSVNRLILKQSWFYTGEIWYGSKDSKLDTFLGRDKWKIMITLLVISIIICIFDLLNIHF